MNIRLSFITPCFNEQDWLPRLLLSLNSCNIDFSLIEFVIVDNGSTDRTVDVLWEMIPTLKFEVKLVHELRKGVSIARNAGAQKATGDIFIFVDADNLLTQEFLNQVIHAGAAPDFCGATIRTLAEPGSIKGSFTFYVLEAIKMLSPRPFGKSIANRDIFFKVGGFDNQVKLGENVVFTSKLKKFAKSHKLRFIHLNAFIYCSLRRFEKVGYLKILVPWLIAYLGSRTLPYETVDRL